MKKTLKVIACGSTVYLFRLHNTEQTIKGTVLQVSIQFDKITYEVEWWNKEIRYTAWFDENLVQAHVNDSNTQTIGFHNG